MEIKIYVANLGKYNEGFLVGEWFTLPVSFEEIAEKIGLNEQYEEYAIHDYEAIDGLKIGEYSSIDDLNEIAEKLQTMDDDDARAALALLDNGIVSDFMDATEKLENVRFYHECSSMAEIAEEFYSETGGIDENNYLMNYIDWERVGRDMEINGTFIQLDRTTWIEYYN